MIHNLRIIFETYFDINNNELEENSINAINLFKDKWDMIELKQKQLFYNKQLNDTIMWNILFDMKVFNIIPKYIQFNSTKVSLENVINFNYISKQYLNKCNKLIIKI
jgi:hypothetical protein